MSLTYTPAEQIAERLYTPAGTYTPLPSLEALDTDALNAYQRDGFIAIEGIFAPEEVAAAKDGLAHLIGGGDPTFQGVQFEAGVDVASLTPEQREPYVRKLMHFVDYDVRLRALGEHPRILSIVRQIFGGEGFRMIQDMALLKPPHIGREKPWHQDCAYFAVDPPTGVAGIWVALDAATVANGCMCVIPGSHLQGPQPHEHSRDCQIPDNAVATSQVVAVPLAPGGILIFSGLLHHGTPPNHSDERRRAVQFHYAADSCRPIDRSEHARYFYEGPAYAGCAV
jgi:hypothetical protein